MRSRSDLRNYNKFVDPEPFKGISNYLVDKADELTGDDSIWSRTNRDVVLLYEKVSREVEYSDTGERVKPPDEMDWELNGDCEDQSVYLASLYAAAICISDFRFTYVVSKDGGRHVLLEVAPYVSGTGPDEFSSDIGSAYRKLYDRRVGEMAWEWDEGKPWFVADPEIGSYVGDISALERNGHVVKNGSDWNWNRIIGYRKVPDQLIHDILDYDVKF